MRLGEKKTLAYITEYLKMVKTNKGIETMMVRSAVLVGLLLKGERKIPISCKVHRRPILQNKCYEGGERKKQRNVEKWGENGWF